MIKDIPQSCLCYIFCLSVYHTKVAAHGLVSRPVPILVLLRVKNFLPKYNNFLVVSHIT
jgi:hypothetical protein